MTPPNAERRQVGVGERSIGELVGDLGRQVSDLVRQEIALAKAEIKQDAREAVRSGSWLGAGTVAAYLAVLFLSLSVALALALVMPGWAAFLIVSVIYAVAATVMLIRGRNEAKKVHVVPQQTVDSLKEDAKWARDRVS